MEHKIVIPRDSCFRWLVGTTHPIPLFSISFVQMADSAGAFSKDNQLVLDGTTSIQDLHSPAAFATTILQEIDQSQDLVILSALYLGTGSQESQIVERAEAALKDTSNRPNFRIKFFFDHSRGQRGSINSVTLLTELVKNYHPRAQVFLYQMPQLRGMVDYLPFQLKELLGVYHCKFSVFDKKAILTGANLSEDYFTNRQDRYFLIGPQYPATNKDQTDDSAQFTAHSAATPSNLVPGTLASYLTSFADVVSKESHELLPNGTLQAPNSVRSGTVSMMDTDLLDLVKQRRISDSDRAKHAHLNINPESGDHRQCSLPAPTCIYPLVQHAPRLRIHQESTALSQLLSQPFVSLHNALLCIATPYTNFRSTFLRTLLTPLQHHCSVELCVPSVPAHGFGSATGIKGFIPLLHFYSLQVEAAQYIKSLEKHDHASHDDKFADTQTHNGATASDAATATYHTFYYMRPEWTYHTKGIWLFPSTMTEPSLSPDEKAVIFNDDTKQLKSQSGTGQTGNGVTKKGTNAIAENTLLTYIGSSNFGERSWSRDFELGFVFATTEAPLQQLFKKEYINMRQHCGMDNSGGVNSNAMQGRVKKNVRGIGGPQKNIPIVPTGLLPQHNSVQKWLLYSIARIIRSFL